MQLTTEAHSPNQMKLMTENLKQATRNTEVLSIWMSSINSLLAESLAVFVEVKEYGFAVVKTLSVPRMSNTFPGKF